MLVIFFTVAAVFRQEFVPPGQTCGRNHVGFEGLSDLSG
jgi:hypothetical protein